MTINQGEDIKKLLADILAVLQKIEEQGRKHYFGLQ